MKDKISASEKPKSCPSQAISEQEGDKKISQLAVTSLVFLCATIPSYGLFYYSFCFYYPQPVSDSIALLFGLLPALAFLTGVTSLGIICVQHKVLKGAPYAIIAVTLSLIPLVQTWEPWQEQRRLAKIPLLEDGFDNLLILGETLLDYAADNDGYLPTAEEWCDRLMQHNPSLTRGNFLHPSAEIYRLSGECHFAFNKNLSGKHLTDVSGDVALLFEADGGWNLVGGEGLLVNRLSKNWCAYVFFKAGYLQSVIYEDNDIAYTYPATTGTNQPRWSP